jgi:hypothetical protein
MLGKNEYFTYFLLENIDIIGIYYYHRNIRKALKLGLFFNATTTKNIDLCVQKINNPFA